MPKTQKTPKQDQMTEKELRKLFKLWRKRLGLDHWQMELRIEPCDSEHSFMEIQRATSYEAALIKVQPWVLTRKIPDGVISLELTDKSVEAKLVHELLHCYMAGMQRVAEDYIDGQLHRDAYSIFRQSFLAEEERAIENLAVALTRNWSMQ